MNLFFYCRHSPAGGGYHSSASPHGTSPHSVSSHSPSNVSHGPPPSHTMVTHGASHPVSHAPPQQLISSAHGIPTHGGSLNRQELPRGEMVRISGPPPPHSGAGVGPAGYPVYQMVSPNVPGPHHSPVSITQHPPSHSQVSWIRLVYL